MKIFAICTTVALGLTLAACNHGNAHATGNSGGGEAPGPAVGPGPGVGNNGGVGLDYRDRVPTGQPGPRRPKGNIMILLQFLR